MLEERIENVVDTILEDYLRGRDIDRLDTLRQPDKNAVIDIVGKLCRIMFPGYFRDESDCIHNTKYDLSMLIKDVLFGLSGQIAQVLQAEGESTEASQCRAQEVCLKYLSAIPRVRELVQTDLQAAFDGDPAASGKAEVILSYPGLYAITVYRLAHELWALNVPLIPRIMTEHAHSVTGIDIHPGATIGKHFFIDHGTGVVIGETTEIGECVKIYQGVTLGGLSTQGGQSLRGTKRHPTIGDNVTIYANATILGGDTVIGKNCVIGASAFITESIPPCTTVSMKDPELLFRTRHCHGCNDGLQ